jgi:putative membrane protein
VLPLWRCYLDKSPVSARFQDLQPSAEATLSSPHPSGENEKQNETQGEKKGWFSFFRQKPRPVEDPEKAIPPNCDRRLKPAMNPPALTTYDYLPFLRIFKPIIYLFGHREHNRSMLGGKRRPELSDSNVPMELTLYLSSYYAAIAKKGYLTPAISTAMWNNIASFQDTLENLERIRNTPLPFAYQVHLRVTLW